MLKMTVHNAWLHRHCWSAHNALMCIGNPIACGTIMHRTTRWCTVSRCHWLPWPGALLSHASLLVGVLWCTFLCCGFPLGNLIFYFYSGRTYYNTTNVIVDFLLCPYYPSWSHTPNAIHYLNTWIASPTMRSSFLLLMLTNQYHFVQTAPCIQLAYSKVIFFLLCNAKMDNNFLKTNLVSEISQRLVHFIYILQF